MKFCKDCKFFKDSSIGYCVHPSNGYHLVTGKLREYLCSVSRDDLYKEDPNNCGSEAKLFELKDILNVEPVAKPKHRLLTFFGFDY